MLIIDVAHLAWRAWHARTADTGAMDKLRADLLALAEGADRVVLAVDLPPYERANLYPPYKANRRDDTGGREAIRGFLDSLRAGGWTLVGRRGAEADDVIATLVAEAERRGVGVAVVTGDKDLWCLAERCELRDCDGHTVDAAKVRERFGVAPELLGELLTLAGDAADNIPGADKVGPKRAAQLLNAFKSVAAVLAVQEVLDPALAKLVAAVHASRDEVEISARLVALRFDVPLDFDALFGAQAAPEPQPQPPKDPPMPLDPPSARPQPAPGPRRPAPARPQPAAQAAPAKPLRRISEATSGLVEEALFLLVYGVEGVGKTSFAAAAPRTFLIGAENGSAEIGHVKRMPAASFEEVLGYVDQLRAEEHDYRTVAIDTLDWLEPLIVRHVCEKGGKPDLGAFSFGAGYQANVDAWRDLVRRLDVLRTARGMNVILVAHSHLKPAKNPEGDDFERYTLKLADKVAGVVKEWPKAVLFADFETGTMEKNGRAKGIDTGRRLLHTRRSAAFDAKNRLWLPAEMPLGWAPFARAVRAGAELRRRFYEAIDKLDDAGREAAIEHMEQHDYTPEAAEAVISWLTNAA